MTDLNFTSLVRATAQGSGLTQAQAHAAVVAMLDAVGQAVAEGSAVRLNNFGSFERTVRTVGPNPFTPEPMQVARVRFTATGRLKTSLESGVLGTVRRNPKTQV